MSPAVTWIDAPISFTTSGWNSLSARSTVAKGLGSYGESPVQGIHLINVISIRTSGSGETPEAY